VSRKPPQLTHAQLSELLRGAPIVLFAIDADGVITMAEGGGLAVLGLRPGDTVGQDYRELYAQQPAVLAALERALKGESFTVVIPFGDALFETRFSPQLDWGGKVTGTLGVATDVSLAHAAALAKDEYLSQLAHELRTPLTTASGWSYLLNQGELGADEARHAHEAIGRSVEDLRRMLGEIRDMAAASEGRLTLDPRPVSLGDLLRDAAQSLLPSADLKGLKLVIDAPKLQGVGDAARLRLAFWHLLSNAVKFSPQGGAVRAALAAERGQAVLTVSDDGPGVEPALRGQLFDRTRAYAPDRKARPRGLGLGLAVVRAVAELHGGSVSCPEGGRGGRFELRLPLPSRAPYPAPAAPAAASAPRLGGLEAVVACADPGVARLAAAVLRFRGAKAAVADERSAAALLRRKAPGLLVTDLVDAGRGSCPLLKALPASSRALALLPDDPELRAKAVKAGFAACVGLPPDPAELAAAAAAAASGLPSRRRPS
jgi:signal transduction histidine kinase/CheY-like chemotaxis protein